MRQVPLKTVCERCLVLEQWKISGDGWWWWLHNNVNVLNAIELYAQKIVKMVNFMLYIFYHSQKLHISIESSEQKRVGQLTRGMASHFLIWPPSFPPSFDSNLIKFLLFKVPSGSDGKESACNARDLDSILGSRRSPGAGHSTILAWRILMDRRFWQATGHGVAKSQTRLSDQRFHWWLFS